MRLGVSPAAAPTPTGVFNQRFEALFSLSWSPGLRGLLYSPPFVRFICVRVWGCGVLPAALPALLSATLSLALSVYLCANVGSQGLLVVRQPAPVRPTLRQSRSHHSKASPLLPGAVSAPPTGLDVCFFFIYLV